VAVAAAAVAVSQMVAMAMMVQQLFATKKRGATSQKEFEQTVGLNIHLCHRFPRPVVINKKGPVWALLVWSGLNPCFSMVLKQKYQ